MARLGKYSIQLRWLNQLNGWDSWNFHAYKTYGYNIRNVETIERDIFEGWDNDFINGDTQQDFLSLKANEGIVVRSQELTNDQADNIARIKFSLKVYDIQRGLTVLVDKSSLQYRTDGDKLNFIEFGIQYPNTLIQSL